MPIFDTDYTRPTLATTEVANGASAVFQQEGAAMFSGLGLGDGGFQANADRMFILDSTGKLASATPYNAQQERNMTVAAQNGRLYVMDKNYRLRQIRLEGNEKDGFSFITTKALSARHIPRNSVDYFVRRFKCIMADFVRDMKESIDKMKESMSKAYAEMKKSWSRIFGGRDQETEPAVPEAKEEPLLPQDTSPEDQLQQSGQSELTTEDLLDKNPTKQTTPEFEKYLQALSGRSNGHLVEAALNKKDGKPEDYYEALAQELEGWVAKSIRESAPSAKDPEAREAFLHKQKPVMAFMSKDLRDFVQKKVDQTLVKDFYAQGLNADSPMGAKLQEEANLLQSTGMKEYTEGVEAHNEATQQTMQQSQLNVNQVQQSQPETELQPPSIGGMGGIS